MARTAILTFVLLAIVHGSSAELPPSCSWKIPDRTALVCSELLPDFSNFDPFEMHFVHELYLQDCKYNTIPNNKFVNLSSTLTILSINCDNITVEANAFAGLSALKSLTVGNGVTNFSPGTLCESMPGLATVNLDNNILSTNPDFGLNPTCGSNWTSLSVASNSIKMLSPVGGFLSNLLQLDTLNISHNQLMTILPGAFGNLNRLKKLDLSHNALLLLDISTFSNLQLLENLDLSYNTLFSISPFLFKNLTKLLELNLRGNSIVMLYAGIFNDQSSLTSLDLRNNQLKSLSTSLKPLNNLNTLLLGSNFLLGVSSKTLGNLSSLHHLDLDNNALTFIDKESFLTTKFLTVLSVNNNFLTYLPTFVFTPTLLALFAANNSITKLDKKQFKLATKLMFLDLSGNQITEINNSTFSNMTSLRKLDLSSNSLISIQNSSFVNVTSLKFLFLQNNNLTFESNIAGDGTSNVTIDLFNPLSSLVYLNLSTNAINRFYYSWFPSKLYILNLSKNNITELPIYDRVADPLPVLRTLDLSRNKITSLTVNQFPPSVINVILNSNYIQTVSPKSFSTLNNLEYLFLRNNVLATLPAMKIPSGLTNIMLRDNPWMCDCRLAWLKDSFNLPFIVYDVMALRCKFLLNKPQEDSPTLVSTSPDKFLCTFKQDGTDPSRCVSSSGPADSTTFAECAYKCPQNCTCYHDITWKIVQVDCAGAGLEETPSDVPDVTQSLYLDGNSLNTVARSAFQNMMMLQQVYLNSSKIVTVEDGAFTTTLKLETLNLGSNLLKKLSINVFDKLHNLTKLDLSFNNLGDLDEAIFAPLASLQVLNLQGNQLKTFPVWTFHDLPKLQKIGLNGNPWSCECTYAEQFRDWLQDSLDTVVSPQNLQCTMSNAVGEIKISLPVFNASRCYLRSPPGGSTAVLLGAPGSVEELDGVNAVVIAITMTITIVVMVIGVLAFVFRREIKFKIERSFGSRLLDTI